MLEGCHLNLGLETVLRMRGKHFMSLTWLDQATRSLELPNRHSIGRLCIRRISNYQRCEMRTDVIVLASLLMPWNVAFAKTACQQGVAAWSVQCCPSTLLNTGGSD